MIPDEQSWDTASSNRRTFLSSAGSGLAGLAFSAMLQREGLSAPSVPTGLPHFAPKAKSVIWFFMNGGTSHLESFDPKPALNKYAGKTIDESPYASSILESPYYRKNVRDFGGKPRDLMPKIF